MRRLAAAALGAIALTGCGSSSDAKPATPIPTAKLAGAPAPLAALHAQRNRLVGGGTKAFKAQLRKLRGYPVVVNAWGSWCGPCRTEFPYFREQAVKRAKTVAFLGVDVEDPESGAREFLREQPVPYPSFKDPVREIAAAFNAVSLPATAFYDERGKMAYLHVGPYKDERSLARDIDRYAR
jgi:cytochrome c biogenesis protein CcmG, thiol:disulfide interchange protein DsbE